MSRSFEKYQKRRLRMSYLSVLTIISLVLFLLGFLGLLIFQTKTISNHFKEQFVINIFLRDQAKDIDFNKIQEQLKNKDFTKSVIFISKEKAMDAFKEDIGEDFMNFLDVNPLKNGFDLYLKAEFVSNEKIEEIKKELLKIKYLNEVSFNKKSVTLLNKGLKTIGFWLLFFSGLLSLIAIVLINSYLRLSIYAKRFTIKTMQMVGATKKFIRKPFLYKSIKLGMLGAIIAIVALFSLLYFFNEKYTNLGIFKDTFNLIILFVGIFILGIFITWISTYFATKRFLNLKSDELHY
jgi:cell division transport system permease protein